LTIAVVAMTAALSLVSAQTHHYSDNDINQGELRSFSAFLGYHPQITQDLRTNPNLANDSNYLQRHPALRSYFQQHPAVQGELKENAAAFMSREQQFETQSGGDINRGELQRFDQFLDRHPRIAADLRKNPPLADDANYLRTHPALQQFLSQHPAIRGELKENPDEFLNRAESYKSSAAPANQSQRDRDNDRDRDRR
jgi:hypothetical protein